MFKLTEGWVNVEVEAPTNSFWKHKRLEHGSCTEEWYGLRDPLQQSRPEDLLRLPERNFMTSLTDKSIYNIHEFLKLEESIMNMDVKFSYVQLPYV